MSRLVIYLLIALALVLSFKVFPNTTDAVLLTSQNTISLSDAVNWTTGANLEQKARLLDTPNKSSEPLYLVLDTPGGYIQAGLELIQNLKSLNRPVHTITIFAASMGFHAVQGLGDRLILPFGTLMAHRASGAFFGEFPGQIDSRYGYYLLRLTQMDELVVSRTKGIHTIESFRNLYANEYWCDGKFCIDQGLADKIVSAQCDQSLSGTYEETVLRLLYKGNTIELVVVKASCPLTTGWLSYRILINGRPLFSNNVESYSTLSLEPEVLKEIQDKINEYVINKQNKTVIRGY